VLDALKEHVLPESDAEVWNPLATHLEDTEPRQASVNESEPE